MKLLWVFSLLFVSIIESSVLQKAIDNAAAGSVLTLSKGTYAGNITIDKPLTIIGKEENVIIKGEGNGSVITITSPHVTLSTLTITGSGNRRERLDAAVTLENTDHCIIRQCHLKDAFYGIVVNRGSHITIKENFISSKISKVPLRGDAIKLWYSDHIEITGNTIKSMRDTALLFVHDIRLTKNTFLHNRLALNLSHSHHIHIEENRFSYNEVGIMAMGGQDLNITHNLIQSCNGVAGIGVVSDKVSHFTFEHNTLRYNTKALYIDSKRSESGYQRFIRFNYLLYNGEALHFHSYIKNNIITHNTIKGNIEDVIKDIKGSYTGMNTIVYNYWDRYEGFDRNSDGIGDTPYKKLQYADELWFYQHRMRFFYGTPVMSLVNFLTHLAPFSEPLLLLEDTMPLMTPPDPPAHR
jgi:nitrous oxidase accessory protein